MLFHFTNVIIPCFTVDLVFEICNTILTFDSFNTQSFCIILAIYVATFSITFCSWILSIYLVTVLLLPTSKAPLGNTVIKKWLLTIYLTKSPWSLTKETIICLTQLMREIESSQLRSVCYGSIRFHGNRHVRLGSRLEVPL